MSADSNPRNRRLEMRRATVLCEVEIEVDLYDADEYSDDKDEWTDIWKEARANARGMELLTIKNYTVEVSREGREDGEADIRPGAALATSTGPEARNA